MTRSPGPNCHPELDADFVAYVESGDLGALARVFDAAAPKLALLAAHLVPSDSQTVEDLVQTTFLEAIRSAQRFDTSRPVLPYLFTILTRRAADRRRKKGPEFTLDARAEEPVDLERRNPSDLASDDEERQQILERIDELGPPYAEVLRLRFVHDFAPGEIARTLGRPVGSVHAQLHRGVRRLRDVLPTALAAVLTTSMAAARSRVIEEARRLAPDASATVTNPSPTATLPTAALTLLAAPVMKALLPALAALALLWLVMDPPDPVPDAEQDQRPSTAQSLAFGEPPTTDDQERQASRELRELDTAEAPAPIVFTGMAFAHESDLPLEGVEVTAQITPESILRTDDERIRTETTMTDSRGRFRLALSPESPSTFLITLTHPDRATMTASYTSALKRGAELDLGRIPMQIGSVLEIELRNHRDQPLTGFGLQLNTLRAGRDPVLRQEGGRFQSWCWRGYQMPDENGVLRSNGPMIPGVWEGAPTAGELGLVEGFTRPFEMPASPGVVRVRLKFAAPEFPHLSVMGRIVDEDGIPVRQARLEARDDQQRYCMAYLASDGQFELPAPAADSKSIRIESLTDVGGGLLFDYESFDPPRVVPVGTSGVVLTARPRVGTEYTLDVRAAHDDRAIRQIDLAAAGYEFRGDPSKGRTLRSRPFRLAAQRLDDGRVDLPPLEADHRWSLWLRTNDPDLEPMRRIELNPAAETTYRVRFEPVTERTVTVLDPLGQPIESAEVQLVAGVWEQAPAKPRRADPLLEFGQSTYQLVVDQASTDMSGRAVLRSGADLTGHALWVRHPSVLPFGVACEGPDANRADWTLRPEGAGILHGRLTPPGELRQFGPDAATRREAALRTDGERLLDRKRIQVWLRPEGEGRARFAFVRDDGSFTIPSVPTEPFRLEFNFLDRRGRALLPRMEPIAAGETRRIEIDMQPLRVRSYRCVVTLGGEILPPGSEVSVPAGFERLPVDARGRFSIERRPGTASIGIRLPTPEGARPIDLETELALTPEMSDGLVRIDLPFRRVRLRCVDAEGSPVTAGFLQGMDRQPDGSERYGFGASLSNGSDPLFEGLWPGTRTFRWRPDADSEWLPIGAIEPPESPQLCERVLTIPVSGR